VFPTGKVATVARLISWLIMVPLAVVVVTFTIANRADVSLDLWPTPIIVDVPLFSLGLVGGFVGFLAGALIAWLSGARRRAEYRKMVRQLEAAKREEASLRERLDRGEPSPSPPAPSTIPEISLPSTPSLSPIRSKADAA